MQGPVTAGHSLITMSHPCPWIDCSWYNWVDRNTTIFEKLLLLCLLSTWRWKILCKSSELDTHCSRALFSHLQPFEFLHFKWNISALICMSFHVYVYHVCIYLYVVLNLYTAYAKRWFPFLCKHMCQYKFRYFIQPLQWIFTCYVEMVLIGQQVFTLSHVSSWADVDDLACRFCMFPISPCNMDIQKEGNSLESTARPLLRRTLDPVV